MAKDGNKAEKDEDLDDPKAKELLQSPICNGCNNVCLLGCLFDDLWLTSIIESRWCTTQMLGLSRLELLLEMYTERWRDSSRL